MVAQKIQPIEIPNPGTEVQVPTLRNAGIDGHLSVRARTELEGSDRIVMDTENDWFCPEDK